MLTKKQKTEIKEHLEKSQNPLFFFDNDCDGLCSFLLLQRYIGRGKGVCVKSFPSLDVTYFRKVEELKADYIFILDKPIVSEEFIKEAEKINIPIVWIDHHFIEGQKISPYANYYNPTYNKVKSSEPVTALCYDITNKKEDLWIAVIGAVTDSFLPEFYSEFLKQYPELGIETKKAFDVVYKSRLGGVAKILQMGLKDTTTNVVNMLKFLMTVKSPYDVLEENSKNHSMHKKSKEIENKYNSLLSRAKTFLSGKLLFFQYGGDLSISGELSNELSYLFPDVLVVVAYINGSKVNLSLRGKNIRGKFLKIISEIEHATGGGHENAVGGVIQTNNLEKFKEELEKVF
jgi:single-stranded DNA-specific DHH superfamily exonuclease